MYLHRSAVNFKVADVCGRHTDGIDEWLDRLTSRRSSGGLRDVYAIRKGVIR